MINSALDRIQFKGLTVKEDETATEDLEMLIEETELKLDADDVHKAAMVCGERPSSSHSASQNASTSDASAALRGR